MNRYLLLAILNTFMLIPASASEPEMTMTVSTADGRETDYPLTQVSQVSFSEKSAEASCWYTNLYGKKIGYNGDSLVESRKNNGGAFAVMISELTGSICENRAMSGASVARASGRRNVVSDIDNMSADLDIIFFGGGVNDYWINVPLGEFPTEEKPHMGAQTDMTYEVDETTFTGALESVFRQAIQKWPGKPIVYMIPHKIHGAYWGTRADGHSFREFTERARKVCAKYGVICFDAERTLILNGGNADHRQRYFYNSDGTHPNEAGYREFYVPRLISLFSSLVY